MQKLILLLALALVIAGAIANTALGYASPIDACRHSPTPQLCANGGDE